jgi:hypothetical protein
MWAFCEHATRNVVSVEHSNIMKLIDVTVNSLKVPMIGAGI